MAEWYVKDLSNLTNVSVQTLHHYDRIGLLRPSVRLSNGYRVYSEKDLLRLQQIVALKFFGFELAVIKELLAGTESPMQHFRAQASILQQKAQGLLEANRALQRVMSGLKDDESLHWQTIIQMIEVYQMKQLNEKTWVKEIFSPQELNELAEFQGAFEASTYQKIEFEDNWRKFLKETASCAHENPDSEIGMHLAAKCMKLINAAYGRKYAHLRTKIFEKGFGEGKGLHEEGWPPEVMPWICKALDAYWHRRAYAILANVGKVSSEAVRILWDDMLDEMYGDEDARKGEVVQKVLSSNVASAEAKAWLLAQKAWV